MWALGLVGEWRANSKARENGDLRLSQFAVSLLSSLILQCHKLMLRLIQQAQRYSKTRSANSPSLAPLLAREWVIEKFGMHAPGVPEVRML
jgi:hypothetical protein